MKKVLLIPNNNKKHALIWRSKVFYQTLSSHPSMWFLSVSADILLPFLLLKALFILHDLPMRRHLKSNHRELLREPRDVFRWNHVWGSEELRWDSHRRFISAAFNTFSSHWSVVQELNNRSKSQERENLTKALVSHWSEESVNHQTSLEKQTERIKLSFTFHIITRVPSCVIYP